MKTNIFNFNRTGLLFQRYFMERSYSELMYWGIIIVIFMFLRNSVPAMTGLILVAGIFYATQYIREIHHPNNGIAYFMIPATQLEKLTVGIVITTLYFFAMMVISYVIGNMAGFNFMYYTTKHVSFIRQMFGTGGYDTIYWFLFTPSSVKMGNFPSGTYQEWSYIIVDAIMRIFILCQSIFFLGGVSFKNNHIFKTTLVVITVLLSLYLLLYVETKLIIGDLRIDTSILKLRYKNILEISNLTLIPFFWIVSYFRLTEKQV